MRRRILQSTLIVVTIMALVLGVPLAVATWRLVEDVFRANLTSTLEQLAGRLDDPGALAQLDASQVELAVPPGGRLDIEQNGRTLLAVGSDLAPSMAVTETLPFAPGGLLTIMEPEEVLRTQQLQFTLVVLMLVAVSVAAGAAVAIWTARRLAEPLSDVADRAARLGAGDFRASPHRYGVPELDRVSDVLDTSAVALADLLQRERDLVGDVSHQLRSRITALQLRLDELSTHPDPSVRPEALAALEQTERLTAVLDELLEAARAARAAGAEVADLREVLLTVADEWRTALRAAGRPFKVRLPDGLLARVTPARLREAVGALLDNAIQHGDGAVTLAARPSDNSIVIEVSDHGAGVPEELVPHVFDRGVSVGSSTGLGLALARALVEADGGRLELSRARPAMFVVFLPTARADVLVGAPRPVSGPR